MILTSLVLTTIKVVGILDRRSSEAKSGESRGSCLILSRANLYSGLWAKCRFLSCRAGRIFSTLGVNGIEPLLEWTKCADRLCPRWRAFISGLLVSLGWRSSAWSLLLVTWRTELPCDWLSSVTQLVWLDGLLLLVEVDWVISRGRRRFFISSSSSLFSSTEWGGELDWL